MRGDFNNNNTIANNSTNGNISRRLLLEADGSLKIFKYDKQFKVADAKPIGITI